jgi:hypothetical protein
MHPKVGRFIDFIGGGISRAAGTGLATRALFIIFGMTPAELVIDLSRTPPPWLLNGLF